MNTAVWVTLEENGEVIHNDEHSHLGQRGKESVCESVRDESADRNRNRYRNTERVSINTESELEKISSSEFSSTTLIGQVRAVAQNSLMTSDF